MPCATTNDSSDPVGVIGAVAALYLNSFVLVVQSFLKIPVLHAMAPTGSELSFVVAQGIVLIFYLVTGLLAVRSFRLRHESLA